MKTAIDWSKAPDDCLGAVHLKEGFTEPKEDYGIFVTKTKGYMEDGYHYCGYTNIGPVMSSHTFTSKPSNDEMIDDDIKPSLLDDNSIQAKISNIGNILHNMSCSMNFKGEQNEFGGYASFLWDLSKDYAAVTTGKTENFTPTYTQSMADNDVLPLVGMEVLYTCIEHQSGKPVIEVGKWYSGTIIAYHDGFVWTSDNGLRQLSNTKFKPVDTRTNSDKAFDKFLSDEYNSNIAEFQGSESDVDFIVGLQSAWKAAIKFQLLEVKS